MCVYMQGTPTTVCTCVSKVHSNGVSVCVCVCARCTAMVCMCVCVCSCVHTCSALLVIQVWLCVHTCACVSTRSPDVYKGVPREMPWDTGSRKGLGRKFADPRSEV